jgi:glycosyltransferase involved in cell wall biosynthesis
MGVSPMTNRRGHLLHIQKLTGIAGSERHLLLLQRGLVERGWRVSMAVLEEPGLPMDEYLDELARIGVQPHRITIRADADPLCLFRLYRLIAAGQFDLVHTHLIHGDLYGTVAAKLAGVRFVVSSKHGYAEYAHPSRFYRLVGMLDPWVDRAITISDALQPLVEQVEGVPRGKMTTIHYGMDITDPVAIERPARGGDPEFRVATVGRLVPVKGLDHLLEAMASLAQRGSRAKLLIHGDGVERARLEERARALGLNGRVAFCGWSRDVPRALADADVFVSATLGEGFGLAILEAMMQELPVVATRVVAIPEIVADEETGLLVPPANPRAIADALFRLESAPDLRARLAKRGRHRAVEQFSSGTMVSRTEALYQEVLTGHGANSATSAPSAAGAR